MASALPAAVDTPPHATPRGGAAAWGILAAISLGRFAFGFQLQAVASLGPRLVAAFHIDFASLGSMVGAYMLPGIVAALGLGLLARRIGDRAVLAGGMALMTVGTAATALADGPHGVGLARAAAGTGAVALTVLQAKVLADRFPTRGFLLALGLMLGAFPIGIGVSQLAHGVLAATYGWRAALLAGAVPSAAALAVLLASWHHPRTAPRTGLSNRAFGWPSRMECLLVIVAGLVWTFHNAGYAAFLTYTPTMLAVHGAPGWVADAVLSLATWGNLPAILFGGAVAARFGAGRVFAVGTLVAVSTIAATALLPFPLLWGGLYGSVGAIHAGVIVAAGALSVRPHNRAVGMGLFYTAYYAGGALFPAVCGHAADLMRDPAGALLCGAALTSLMIPCWWLHQTLAARPGAIAPAAAVP